MTVHKFRRPDLSDALRITLEQLDGAESALTFFVQQRTDTNEVLRSVKNVGPEAFLMLEQEIEELDVEIATAEAMIQRWKEILEDLQSRAAHPQTRRQ